MGNEQSSEQSPEDREAERRRAKKVEAEKHAKLNRQKDEKRPAYVETFAKETDSEQAPPLSDEQATDPRKPPWKPTSEPQPQPEPHKIPFRSIGSSQRTPEPACDNILQTFKPRKEPLRSDAARLETFKKIERLATITRVQTRDDASPPTTAWGQTKMETRIRNIAMLESELSPQNVQLARRMGAEEAVRLKQAAQDREIAKSDRQRKLETTSLPSAKRPASTTSAYADERRASTGRLPKIAKRSSAASPQSVSEDSEEGQLVAVGDERPPQWYQDIRPKNVRSKNSSNVDTLLQALRTQITKSQTAARNGDVPQNSLELIRDKLHKIVFIEVTAELLKQNRMLHNEDGLPQLFDDNYAKGVEWPFDIKADARELYNKWCRRIFETDMFRGIVFKVKAAKDKKDGANNTESIDPEYRGVVSARYHGNGGLLNGQWWPTLLCAYRDGAHGMTIAGICGNSGQGAYSVFMSSGGHDYSDEDHGEEVLYCGTDSDNGSITENTRYMLESVNKHPVRLLRSAKLDSPYAPKLGFRYDGLYDVVSYENLDGSNSLRQRHRFRLVRQPGQDPIRGGNGPDRRPTEQEIEHYKKHRYFAGKNKSTA